jgi:hypothetical protein
MSIDKLKKARDHVREWIEGSRSVATAAPQAQMLEEQLDWEVRTLERRPAEAFNISTTGIDDRSEDLLRWVTTCFPRLPTVDIEGLTYVNSVATSTSSETVAYIMDVGQI